MKTALVLAPFIAFDSSSSRPHCVAQVLARFSRVDIITSDFDHQTKCGREPIQREPFEQVFYIKTIPYYSNTSPRRLFSHVVFALRASVCFWRRSPRYDAVYVTLPLNLVACIILWLSRAKTRIVDVVDIWPDVLPFSAKLRARLAPFFWLWRYLFVVSIRQADQLMAVSDRFYQEGLRYFTRDPRLARRFYIGHAPIPNVNVAREERFTIAFVGNIGHLADFDTLLAVLGDGGKGRACQLFIVGDGDRRTWLLNDLQKRDIAYEYFGIVRDPSLLAGVLRRSHVGFNGYANTSAAFSYKATTYFAASLPILNSMQGDLEHLVQELELGFNYIGGDEGSLKRALTQCTPATLERFSGNCARFAEQELRVEVLQDQIGEFLQTGTWLRE